MRPSAASNAGPLIHLAQTGQLHLLRQLYGTILIPREVKAEAVDRGKERGAADAVQIEEAITEGWIKIQETAAPPEFTGTAETAGLDEAEAEVIYLAKNSGTPALLDDEAARTFARALGLEVRGSIGVIIQAQRDGRIEKEEALEGLERLSRVMYLNVDVYRLARREMDQMPQRDRRRRPRGN